MPCSQILKAASEKRLFDIRAVLQAQAETQAREAEATQLAERERERAERERERAEKFEAEQAEKNAREAALLSAHVCERCGYDEPSVPLGRRMCARWEGQCAHRIWETPSGIDCDLDRCHHIGGSSCSVLKLNQYARLRCRRCAWEVPNFLRPRPLEQPQPLVPPSVGRAGPRHCARGAGARSLLPKVASLYRQ